MNKKAIRILIVGGRGTGKSTLAKKIAEIIRGKGVSITVVDEGVRKPFRAALPANRLNTIVTHQGESFSAVGCRYDPHLFINLTRGSISTCNIDELPDELRQPIMDAASEQIKWVNEKFPMRNGRVTFKEEAGEISEEDKKKLIETSTHKEGGEVERTLTSNDEVVIKVLKSLAQDLAKMAKRKQKRRQTYRYIRYSIVTLCFLSFLAAIFFVEQNTTSFIRAFVIAVGAGILSNLLPND